MVWDGTGEKLYENGIDHVGLYLLNASTGLYDNGVPWNGVTGITESPTGAEPTALYADNIKYLNLMSAEDFGATVTAYTYPDEFAPCDGSAEPLEGLIVGQQSRTTFGLSYRTILGNDVLNDNFGYKLHLIYGCLASPSEKAYATVNESPSAIEFSWSISCTPVNVPNLKPTSRLVIDSTKVSAEGLAALEALLYGPTTGSTNPSLPLPEVVIATLSASSS
jgi:hypothetical protein